MEADREPPIVVFLSAASYFKAAQHLRLEDEMQKFKLPFRAPIYYLFCHALELTMKAFLRAKGMTAEELRRDFGHKLLVLWQACLEKGLHSPSSSKDCVTQRVIEYLDPYARDFEFRYIQVGAQLLPLLEDVELAASRLLGVVKPFVTLPSLTPPATPP